MNNKKLITLGLFMSFLPFITYLDMADNANADTYYVEGETARENTAWITHKRRLTRHIPSHKNIRNRHHFTRNEHNHRAHFRTAYNSHHHRHFRRHRSGVIQCVAYAKAQSGIILHANAGDWWSRARGLYDRGHEPEAGSILNFRPVRRMPLGHVAVVHSIINNREITVDHSHWGQPGPRYNVPVIDISDDNDWSRVRVAMKNRPLSFGSVYPTYGFIYPRPPEHTRHRNHYIIKADDDDDDDRNDTKIAQMEE